MMNDFADFKNVSETGLDSVHMNHVKEGRYFDVLRSQLVQNLVSAVTDGNSFKKTWTELINTYITDKQNDERRYDLLAPGIASLLLFIQQNWTGPEFEISQLNEIISDSLHSDAVQNEIIKELVLDGESLVDVVKYPELLLLASELLSNNYEIFKSSFLGKLWYLRCLYVHQHVLDELSPLLHEKMTAIITELQDSSNDLNSQQLTQLNLEFSRVYLYYSNVNSSKTAIENAMKNSGLRTSFSGALGKRTRFQQDNVSQLTLEVSVEDDKKLENNDIECAPQTCPTNVTLNDEVRLNKVEFANNSVGEHPDLTGFQQAVILTHFHQIQKSEARDTLADEELQVILSCVLDKPKLWCIQYCALYLRSKMETTHKRTVERAMLQIETLLDSLKLADPPATDRLNYFFISHLPPKWATESMFASILISLGSIKSALDVFLRLKQWEEVIQCYNALGLRHKAQEIIEQEMAKKETPKLWCLLGDATDDPNCYEKAWALSDCRSAKAQRHWALYLYYRKKYSESIDHFQLSLKLNSLQGDLWFRLAYAALHEERWEISAEAYRRYVVLDTESFEAWNNLARCYCELKQIPRAWRALQEALKIDYNNWRVWDNYMLVSSDLKEYEEVVRSYQQVLDLKEKHVDIPVLKALVQGVLDIVGQESSKESEKLRNSVLTLFGRLTAQVINDAELWYLYSEMVTADSPQDLVKKHQLLLKSYRSAANKPNWEKEIDSCKRMVHILNQLIDVSLRLDQRSDQVSAKMAASGTIAKIEKQHETNDMCTALKEKLVLLIEALEKKG